MQDSKDFYVNGKIEGRATKRLTENINSLKNTPPEERGVGYYFVLLSTVLLGGAMGLSLLVKILQGLGLM